MIAIVLRIQTTVAQYLFFFGKSMIYILLFYYVKKIPTTIIIYILLFYYVKKIPTTIIIYILLFYYVLLLTLLSVDTISMHYSISQNLAECNQLTETIKILTENGEVDQESINKLFRRKCELLQSLSKNRTIINQMHDKFPFVHIHSFFNKS